MANLQGRVVRIELAESGYISRLDVEERQFALDQAQLEVDLKKTQIRVLKDFTKAEQMETLRGDVAATKANHNANVERAEADKSRRDRALAEYEHCVIRAERGGFDRHHWRHRWTYSDLCFHQAGAAFAGTYRRGSL